MDNLIANPEEVKFHKIRCSNATFQEKVLPILGATDFLYAAGFRQQIIENKGVEEEYWVWPVENIDELANLQVHIILKYVKSKCSNSFFLTQLNPFDISNFESVICVIAYFVNVISRSRQNKILIIYRIVNFRYPVIFQMYLSSINVNYNWVVEIYIPLTIFFGMK